MGKNLSDATLVAEMVRFMGPAGAARLFGWLMLAVLSGANDRHELLTVEWAAQATRYRVWRDVRALRAYLADRGYDLTEAEVVERVVHGGRFAGAS